MSPSTWLVLHLAATSFMTGVISICHWVHYPLMRLADKEQFTALCRSHQFRISWIVIPCMLFELVCAISLVLYVPQERTLGVSGLACLVGIWVSTATLQGPQHRRLLAGYDADRVAQLVRQNRWRVLLWWARLVIACILMLRA